MSDPVAQSIRTDRRRWIFPLRSAHIFANANPKALRDHINSRLLHPPTKEGFVAGQLAYARKDQHHLRRVLVLDPFATFFLYDFAHHHRDKFPRSPAGARQVFGHSFENGAPVSGFAEYHRFRRRKYDLVASHGHFAHVDIFNCFNSFYHHDVISFITTRTSQPDGQHFGQFLREMNAGVSVACFPQGLYPAKAIGNAYLSFIETSRRLTAPALTRFLDDVVLFASSRRDVDDQILELQYVLDAHHLALNDSKTTVGDKNTRFGEKKLDRIRRSLLRKREAAKLSYDEDEELDSGLTDKEREYLGALIQRKNVAQEDIELALTLMRHETDAVELLTDPVLDAAPHLLRGLHGLLGRVDNVEGYIWAALKLRLGTRGARLAEHDLFWYARILIDHFVIDQDVADLLLRIYQLPNATPVVKAAILETAALDHGLADLKETVLRNEGHVVLASAAMVGVAALEKAKRNHIYGYASRLGSHVATLAEIARTMPSS